jgi:hypothetical protein
VLDLMMYFFFSFCPKWVRIATNFGKYPVGILIVMAHKKLRRKKLFIIFFLMGFLLDVVFMGGKLGLRFTFSIPLFLFLLLSIIHLSKIRNGVAIIALSTLCALACMILTFMSYSLQYGDPSDMWGLVYIVGFIPALLIGSLFGIYLSFAIKESETNNIRNE